MRAQPGETINVPFNSATGAALQLFKCSGRDLDPVGAWIDMYLRDDFFFRRGHLKAVLERETNDVFAVLHGGEFVGIWIEYEGSVLQNLYIEPAFRKLGIGSALVEFRRPLAIRAKTDMTSGDPVPFYARHGYGAFSPDPLRPHILLAHDMRERPSQTPGLEGAGSTIPATLTHAASVFPGGRVAGMQPAPFVDDRRPPVNPLQPQLPLPATPPSPVPPPHFAAAAGGFDSSPALNAALSMSDALAAQRYREICIKRREKQIARRDKAKRDAQQAALLHVRGIVPGQNGAHNGYPVHPSERR